MGGVPMRYAVIQNSVVVNVVAADEPLFENWVEGETASIGDLYIDGEFVKPPLIEQVVET
jgi:hypothetical protein